MKKDILFKVCMQDEFCGTQYVLAESIKEALDMIEKTYPGKFVLSIETVSTKILRKK